MQRMKQVGGVGDDGMLKVGSDPIQLGWGFSLVILLPALQV